MPVHEYECDVCGIRFDLRRSFGEHQPSTCPDGHQGVHRVFTPPTIIFKGSGFYVTDNRSSTKANRPSTQDKKPSEEKEPQEKKEPREKKEPQEKTKTGDKS